MFAAIVLHKYGKNNNDPARGRENSTRNDRRNTRTNINEDHRLNNNVANFNRPETFEPRMVSLFMRREKYKNTIKMITGLIGKQGENFSTEIRVCTRDQVVR